MRQEAGGGDRALGKALAHPIRARLATILGSRPATAAELASMTGLPAERVRYHLRILRRGGIIDSAEETVCRGTVERSFFATSELIIDDEEFAAMNEGERRRVGAYLVRTCFRDATAALVEGSLSQRADDLVTRVPLDVDEEGWVELARIHREALQAVQALKAQVAERLAKSGAEPMRATSILMCFEGPRSG